MWLLLYMLCDMYVLHIEIWWVLRTPSKFVVNAKKGFAVTNPVCTYDQANNRYFPYAILNEDGTTQQ